MTTATVVSLPEFVLPMKAELAKDAEGARQHA
jgi:hypothetical protein